MKIVVLLKEVTCRIKDFFCYAELKSMVSVLIYCIDRLLKWKVTRENDAMVQVDRESNSSSSSLVAMMSEIKLEDSSMDKDLKMVTFDHLPLEVKEVIFLFLSPRDLKQCSLVCMRWQEIVNSNRIWLKICEVHGLSKKKFLEDSYSMIENPMKHYAYKDPHLAPSRWRSHFNRYRFVQRNWELGYFVLYSHPMTPMYMNEDYIIQHVGKELVIHNVQGQIRMLCSIDVVMPELKIDTIMCKNEHIIYSQNRKVVCLKNVGQTFREVFKVVLEEGNCNQPRNCVKSQLTIRISEKFILVQDPLNPCVLSFFETNDICVRRQVDLHRALGNQSLFCTCLEVMGERVFLGYRMGTGSYLAQYDYSKDVWEGPVLVIPNRAVELYLNQKYVCAKLNAESRDQHYSQTSNLYVWSREPQCKVGEFCGNKHVPVLLTANDLMIYSFRDEVTIRKLGGFYEKSFCVSYSVLNICLAWNKFLVVHDEMGISVWDSNTGKKVVSPLRSESCITVCASDTNILLRCEDDRFHIVSFW